MARICEAGAPLEFNYQGWKMAASIVPEILTGPYNYARWSGCMKNYFIAHDDIWDDVIERSGDPPNPEEDEVKFKAWKKKNAAALHAIQISCSPDIFSEITDVTSAKLCWDQLAQICKEDDAQETEEDEFAEFLPLYKDIEGGDLDGVKSFLLDHQDAINQKIVEDGSTALHLATLQGNIELVKELLELMSDEGVEITDNLERTALYIAAEIRDTKIAELLVKKNEKLLSVPSGYYLPVTVACYCGHKDTTLFLYSQTPMNLLLEDDRQDYGAWLLLFALQTAMLDIALDLIRKSPLLAIRRLQFGTLPVTSPLLEFSSMHYIFPSGCNLVFWKRWIYSCIQIQLSTSPNNEVRIPINGQMQHGNCSARVLFHQFQIMGSRFLSFFGIQQIYDLKLKHSYALELIQLISEAISTVSKREHKGRKEYAEAFFNAANWGIVEFFIAITKANPSLLYLFDQNSLNVLHVAVQSRQENIFNYIISALRERNYVLLSRVDCSKNNLLHLAAMIAPTNTLERISGAALQMQRELQWYKEVESIAIPSFKNYINEENLTPRKLFTKEHKQLMAEGEKWMKETAQSCTVVGALIITIMFAMAFTVPGGNNQESGYPIFFHENAFKVFIISDAISLFASSTSVITFLGVLTSRYTEEDFLISLPKKMIIGLSTLFISIAALMVSFCATLIIMLDGNLNIIIPTVLLASIPVTVFMLLQFPLLLEIFMSTYGPSIFNRKKKNL